MCPNIDLLDEIGHAVGVISEDRLDRLRLGGVVVRRRGAVGVDVVHLGRLHARARERVVHHLDHADRLGVGGGDVVGVVRGAVAGELAVDARAAACGRARAPPAPRTPAPSAMTNPARVRSNGREAARRVVAAVDQGAHRAESGQDDGQHRRLGRAGQDHVGLPALDRRRRLADRMGAGRAGRLGARSSGRARRASSRRGSSSYRRACSAASAARPAPSRAPRGSPAGAACTTRPPITLPMTTPTRLGSSTSSCASRAASIAAATPKWTSVAVRRTSFGAHRQPRGRNPSPRRRC